MDVVSGCGGITWGCFKIANTTIDVNLYKYLSAEDLSQDIELKDGDAVVVPFVEE